MGKFTSIKVEIGSNDTNSEFICFEKLKNDFEIDFSLLLSIINTKEFSFHSFQISTASFAQKLCIEACEF